MNYRCIFLSLIMFSLFSQAQNSDKSLHYVFPEFKKGVILMDNKSTIETLFNYNILTEELVFDQNGEILAIGNDVLPKIDTVFIDNRKFIRLNNKFVEVLIDNNVKLFVQYKCKFIPPGKPAAYGGTSQTSSAKSVDQWLSGGVAYRLQLPNDYQVRPYSVYWIEKEGGDLEDFTSLKQLNKFYDKKKNVFKQYTKEHKIDFNNAEAVSRLIEYMEAN